jgi:predicted ATPase/class 3 adenylate cyclase
MDIADWLRELGLERYEQAFRDNDVNAKVLPHLTAEDLKDIGITSVGHRRSLLAAIEALRPHAIASEPEKSLAAASTAVQPTRAAERRQLTVMFVDLVGSTELASRLDPEDMGGIIRAYQNCCAEVVGRWDGHVAKYMCDGLLAYFGYPRAHEDDAERAVRAGLELAKAVSQLADDGGRALACRIAIATGQVVVGELIGEGAAQEEAVIGETPNLAARLQEVAEPGSAVVAATTRNLIGALFELADLGERGLKGFEEPVRAWQVLGESRAESRFEAFHGRQLTTLVGREHEIGLLVDRWERAKQGEGQVVLLSGEPGIGKSRIVQALRERLADQTYIPLSHYCSPHHTNSALYPVIGLLERAAGFERDDRPADRLDKLEALLARGSDRLDEVVPLVAALLELPVCDRYPPVNLAPPQQKQRTLEVLMNQVAGLAASQPVLAIYEDVHWIDPTTFEALSLLIERVQRLPVLAVVTARPEFDPPWAGHAHVLRLSLTRLTRRHGAEMALQVTGGKALPDEVVEQIVARTDGVPMFVEELTKNVLETGLLRDTGARFELASPLPPLAIPSTLHDSLMARLDRLATIKPIAQIGAVIGRAFAHELLAAIAPLPEDQLSEALDQLVASELVFRRGMPPAATYVFKHALVQDAAYQSLLKSRRQQLHARIAEYLEQEFTGAADADPEQLAHHYTQAERVPQAVSYWLRAGQKAAEHSADQEAAAHLTQGLDLVVRIEDPQDRATRELDLRIALGPVIMNIKGSADPEVAASYERALELCADVGRPDQAFPVLWGLWLHHHLSGRLEPAARLAEQLIEVARGLSDTVFQLQAQHAAWTSRYDLGELAPALEHVVRGLQLYDQDQHAASAFVYGGHDAGVCAYSSGGLIRFALGQPDGALRLADDGVRLARRLGQPFSLAQALCFRAIVHQLRGDVGRVAADADHLLAHCAEHHLEAWARNGHILKGWTLVARGDTDGGLALLRPAIDQRRTSGVKTRQAYYLALFAEALAEAGQPGQALDAVAEALQISDNSQDRRWDAIALRVHADLLGAAPFEDYAAAEASLERAREIARQREARSFELRAATSLARLLAVRGEGSQARDLLAPVYAWFTEGFDTADLKDAKALLDDLG